MSVLTLAIETSNPGPAGSGGVAGSVCVGVMGHAGEPARVVSVRELSPASRHDDALMPAIDGACRDAGVTPARLARVAVSIGPGGFTSTRIAVTTAKMISEATGAACIGVPTSRGVALSLGGSQAGRVVGVLLAWKRADVWRCRYRVDDSGVTPLNDETSSLIVRLERAGDGVDVVCCDPLLREALPEGMRGACVPIEFHARHVLAASAGFSPIDPAKLTPLYPREPEAVTKWRELHPKPNR